MPRSPKGHAAARGLDAASARFPCLLEMLHSKQLRSTKMLIDSNHGIYRGENPAPGKDVHGRRQGARRSGRRHPDPAHRLRQPLLRSPSGAACTPSAS